MSYEYKKLQDKNILENLKNYSANEIKELSLEVREKLIETVSKNGGHLASNLGVVELTIAMHRVFDSPKDQFVFDVGHQCYTHKLLTGRFDDFDTLRQENGISGFPKPSESIHDAFVAGHSSTSLSVACGLVAAKTIKKEEGKVLAVIGDGAFTNGMVYEGLNNINQITGNNNLIVVLNDNEMSISKNVGGIANYLGKVRTKKSYIKLKVFVKKILAKIPLIGSPLSSFISKAKESMKSKILRRNFFEDLGFFYIGPINGHDVDSLEKAFEFAKDVNQPVFIQVNTIKGKGFIEAETNPGAFHGVSSVDRNNPKAELPSEDSYSLVVGKHLVELANSDDTICAVTAAMKYATGLNFFHNKHPERFFDVGIAEEHAVTFAAALAEKKMKPIFAVYSTFLQRVYDQILHDAAINNTHIVLAIDRAGIVGDDGETHQGVFDVAFLSTIPNVKIFSPYGYEELKSTFNFGIYEEKGVVAIRYPRGKENLIDNQLFHEKFEIPEKYNEYTLFESQNEVLICTYGREFSEVANAYDGSFDILKLNRLNSFSNELIGSIKKYKKIFFYEEGIKQGGIGQLLLSKLVESSFKGDYKHIAIDNHFVKQATIERALEKLELDSISISKEILKITKQKMNLGV